MVRTKSWDKKYRRNFKALVHFCNSNFSRMPKTRSGKTYSIPTRATISAATASKDTKAENSTIAKNAKFDYKANIQLEKKINVESKVNGIRLKQLLDGSNLSKKKVQEVFKCPVCLNLPPCDIYQCNEGHLICMDCYNKSKRKSPVLCQTCRTWMPSVPIRNRAAEQV